MSENPPGWYRDPAEPTTQRYWDGDGWVGDPLPIDAPAPAGPFTTPSKPAAPAPGQLPPGVQVPPGWPAPPAGGPTPPVPNWPPSGTRPVRPAPPNWPAGLPNPYDRNAMGANLRPHGFVLAPLGSRFVARVVDIFAVLLLNAALSWYLVLQYIHETRPYWRALMEASRTHAASVPTMSSRGSTLLYVILAFAVVIWAVYEVPSTGRYGQTFGKYLVGIRVIGLEGTTELGGRRAFRRWSPLGFGTLLWPCCVGFLIQGIDCLAPTINRPFKLALHDVYAATVVVEVPPKNSTPTPTDRTSDEQKSVNGGIR